MSYLPKKRRRVYENKLLQWQDLTTAGKHIYPGEALKHIREAIQIIEEMLEFDRLSEEGDQNGV